MTPLQKFHLRFPEFNDMSYDRIQLFLDDALLYINTTFWGEKAEVGQFYLAAHLLSCGEATNEGQINGVSNLTSHSADGASVSFGSIVAKTVSDIFYQTTKYGQHYLMLKQSVSHGIGISIV